MSLRHKGPSLQSLTVPIFGAIFINLNTSLKFTGVFVSASIFVFVSVVIKIHPRVFRRASILLVKRKRLQHYRSVVGNRCCSPECEVSQSLSRVAKLIDSKVVCLKSHWRLSHDAILCDLKQFNTKCIVEWNLGVWNKLVSCWSLDFFGQLIALNLRDKRVRKNTLVK